MPNEETLTHFSRLLEIVATLRGPGGCPWDREQTHQSLTRFAIEEAYELAQAIDQGDDRAIVEELGDVLLQVVLHSEIAQRENRFTVDDVVRSISDKMIRRHPHVFSKAENLKPEEVKLQWQNIKRQEKPEPKTLEAYEKLPPLLAAHKIGEKTAFFNFDWSAQAEVYTKVQEELGELEQELNKKDLSHDRIEQELGDVLFSLSQLARHLQMDAETALRRANRRFTERFQIMLKLVDADGSEFRSLSSKEKESYWKKAKQMASEK